MDKNKRRKIIKTSTILLKSYRNRNIQNKILINIILMTTYDQSVLLAMYRQPAVSDCYWVGQLQVPWSSWQI